MSETKQTQSQSKNIDTTPDQCLTLFLLKLNFVDLANKTQYSFIKHSESNKGSWCCALFFQLMRRNLIIFFEHFSIFVVFVVVVVVE